MARPQRTSIVKGVQVLLVAAGHHSQVSASFLVVVKFATLLQAQILSDIIRRRRGHDIQSQNRGTGY